MVMAGFTLELTQLREAMRAELARETDERRADAHSAAQRVAAQVREAGPAVLACVLAWVWTRGVGVGRVACGLKCVLTFVLDMCVGTCHN